VRTSEGKPSAVPDTALFLTVISAMSTSSFNARFCLSAQDYIANLSSNDLSLLLPNVTSQLAKSPMLRYFDYPLIRSRLMVLGESRLGLLSRASGRHCISSGSIWCQDRVSMTPKKPSARSYCCLPNSLEIWSRPPSKIRTKHCLCLLSFVIAFVLMHSAARASHRYAQCYIITPLGA
jgi:hypothetical protein